MFGAMQSTRRCGGAAAGMMLAAALTGCALFRGPPPALCPPLGLLPDAGTLTRFQPGAGPDVTGIDLEAAITGLTARCHREGARIVADITLTVSVRAGPLTPAGPRRLTVFAAAQERGGVPERRDRPLRFDLPAAPQTLTVTAKIEDWRLPRPPGGDMRSLRLFAGFELTRAEVAYNRAQARLR